MMLTMHSTMSGIFDQMDETSKDATAMGQAFDAAKNDDSFYLPPEVFENPDFQRAMNSFLSPDGKAARFIISHKRRSRDARGHSAYRSDKDGGRGGAQGDTAGERQDLYRRHRVDREGLARRLQIRSLDRGNCCALPYFHHHAHHHARFYCRPGHRGYGGTFVGRIVWAVGAGLAVYSGHQFALDGTCDVCDHPFGGGV